MVPRWYSNGTQAETLIGVAETEPPDGPQMVPRWHPDGTQAETPIGVTQNGVGHRHPVAGAPADGGAGGGAMATGKGLKVCNCRRKQVPGGIQ